VTQERIDFSDVREIGTVEQSGQVVVRDLILLIGEREFALTVASHKYLEELGQYNQDRDPELQLFDKMLPFESVMNEADVISKLHNMEKADVVPYLIEQEDPTKSGLAIDFQDLHNVILKVPRTEA